MIPACPRIAELPLDAVEFLSEAEDSEVGAFMDTRTVPKQREAAPVDAAEKASRHVVAEEEEGEDEAEPSSMFEEGLGEAVTVGAAAPVKFIPEGGRIIAESQVKLVPQDPAVVVHYTLDGSTPSTSSKK